jgi:type 1 fimbriae regulatory protein FimB/type 1 fimbriae regulatory protein FimE
MILVTYRHGLTAPELTDLRWDQIDFATATLHVRRVKQGSRGIHPILGDELRSLRRLQREQEPKSPFVFTWERGAPLAADYLRGLALAAPIAGAVSYQLFSVHNALELNRRIALTALPLGVFGRERLKNIWPPFMCHSWDMD